MWVVEAGGKATGRSLSGLLKLQSRFEGRLLLLTGYVPDEELLGKTAEQIRDHCLLRLGFGVPVEVASETLMVGACFLGLIELSPDAASWDRTMLQGLAAASQSTTAPLLVTIQDLWGETTFHHDQTSQLADGLAEMGAARDRICLCRLPCSLENEAAYTLLLTKVSCQCSATPPAACRNTVCGVGRRYTGLQAILHVSRRGLLWSRQ